MLKNVPFFFHFHQVTLLYHHECMGFWLIIIPVILSFLWVISIIVLNCQKLSETGGIYLFRI